MTQAETQHEPKAEAQAQVKAEMKELIDRQPYRRKELGELTAQIPNALAMAKVYAASGVYGNVTETELALKIMVGEELGIGPAEACRYIYVTKSKDGRAAYGMEAELMRSLYMSRLPGAVFRVEEWTPEACAVAGARAGQPPMVVRYTIDDAKRAGLTDKATYKYHPKSMLLARATALFMRAYAPDLLHGVSYCKEEIEELAGAGGDKAATAALAALEDFLKAVPPKHQPPPESEPAQEPPKPDLSAGRAAFVAALQALSDRDCQAYKVSKFEGAYLWPDAVKLSGLKTHQEVAEWISNHARLIAEERDTGTIQLKIKEKTE